MAVPTRTTSFTPDTVGLIDGADFPDLAGLPAPRVLEIVPRRAVRARVALRVLAKLTDGAIAGVLYCLCTLLIEDWLTGFFVGGLVGAGLILTSDALGPEGRSFGKRLVGLYLARLDGGPVDTGTSVRRNWMFVPLFFVQAFTFDAPLVSLGLFIVALGLIGFEWCGASASVYGCRWGDTLADTEVLERAKPERAR